MTTEIPAALQGTREVLLQAAQDPEVQPALAGARAAHAPRTLLVGVDAEGLSDHAIHAALELEKRLRSKLVLLHAVGTSALSWENVEDPADTARSTALVLQATRVVREHLRELLRARGEDGARAEDLLRVVIGPPAKVLSSQARELDADLILLGTHKRRGWIDLGSTLRGVLSQAPKAIWLQTAPLTPLRAILCPVDLSSESLQALHHACHFARAFGARVEVLHVFHSSQYVLSTWPDYPDLGAAFALDDLRKAARAEFERVLAEFDWQGVAHTLRFQEGEPAERMLELEDTHDLVIMGTHGRTGLAGALVGSVAYCVIKRCKKPVLAIRHPERELLR
jgi:nucleotide-binding universal stress UspA family protein